MRVSILAFGKLKTPGMDQAARYYQGLLNTYVPTEQIELKPIPVPDKSEGIRRQIQKKEAQLLQKKFASELGSRGIFYLLDEGGKTRTTQAWAEQVRQWEREGVPQIIFCIGSSLGFSEELRQQAQGRIVSLGPQTLPHELARVVLLEQLYRAWSVTRGHPYHNEGS